MKRDKAKPAQVGSVVTAVLERLGIAEQVERATVLAEWDDIVGPHIARVARPVGVNEGTLFVEVENASWRMELNMMRTRILRQLNRDRRRGAIERIVWLQADGPATDRGDTNR